MTVLFTTLMLVILTVLLMMVVLLTTVVGRTGSRKRRGSTKTKARGAMTATSSATEPPTAILAEGCNGAQPTQPPPSCQETQAGAHCVCGTQYQPNCGLKSHRP